MEAWTRRLLLDAGDLDLLMRERALENDASDDLRGAHRPIAPAGDTAREHSDIVAVIDHGVGLLAKVLQSARGVERR